MKRIAGTVIGTAAGIAAGLFLTYVALVASWARSYDRKPGNK